MIHPGKRSASTFKFGTLLRFWKYDVIIWSSELPTRSIKVASATVLCEFNGIYIEISAEVDGNTF
jgi:hypothetical protein